MLKFLGPFSKKLFSVFSKVTVLALIVFSRVAVRGSGRLGLVGYITEIKRSTDI